MSGLSGERLPVSTVVVAHELKSPLLAILQLARELSLHAHSQQSREVIEHIIVSAESGLRFAQSLTHVDAFGERLIEVEPLRSDVIAAEIQRDIEALARASGIAVKYQPSRLEGALCLGNKDIIKAILLSLCDNAIRHASPSTVRLSVRRKSGSVLYCVKNDGIVPAYRSAAIEDRAFQWGRNGIGLWIANELASRINGRIGRHRHIARGGATYWLAVPESTQLSLL